MQKCDEKFKRVTIEIPDPPFSARMTIRDRLVREHYQGLFFDSMMNKESPYFRLIKYFHGEDIANVIHDCFYDGGHRDEGAEMYLLKIFADYSLKAPIEMWSHWLRVVDFEKARACYYFLPMIMRFLSLTVVSEYQQVSCRCKERLEEYDYLCEEMGLSYRFIKKKKLGDGPFPFPLTGGQSKYNLTIEDIVNQGVPNIED